MSQRDFPSRFLFGSATSSHQVEGGNDANDWWAWEQVPGHIADGGRSGDAAGWWAGRAEEDLGRAAELGQNAHRMSLEWSRLEPEPGRFEASAFARYREILDAARGHGLKVLLTLNHFTLPRWLAARGGWMSEEIIARFERFASRAANELGGRVDLWATLNEPMVLGWMGYAGTRWPPGLGSLPDCFVALGHMLRAHAAAYRALHRALPSPEVGLVLNLPRFAPSRPKHPLDRAAASAQDWAFNGAILHALGRGVALPPLSKTRDPMPELRGSFDYLGLNYYGRFDVRFDPKAAGTLFGRHVQSPTIATDDNDWGAPDPGGMVAQLERLAALGRPVYVTENGIFDPSDEVRPEYLRSHLEALAGALRRGLDLRGYFVWSLVDNFEWAEGWKTPFGLLALDRERGTREARPSAALYQAICRERRVPREFRG